jgi:hypothetical protein
MTLALHNLPAATRETSEAIRRARFMSKGNQKLNKAYRICPLCAASVHHSALTAHLYREHRGKLLELPAETFE